MEAEQILNHVQFHQFSELMEKLAGKMNIHFSSGGKPIPDKAAFTANGVTPILVEHSRRMTTAMGFGDWMGNFETEACRDGLAGYMTDMEPLGAADCVLATSACLYAMQDIQSNMKAHPDLSRYCSKTLRGAQQIDVEGIMVYMRLRHGESFLPGFDQPRPVAPGPSSPGPGM